MGKNRTAIWDNARFIMITLMVIGHFADVFCTESDLCRSIYLFIYAFHMPVLFFISGLFYKNERIVEKVIFFISCGFLLKICLMIAALVNGMSVGFSLLSDSGIPWFFFVLAAFNVYVYITRPVDRTYLLVMSVILVCFVGYDKTVGHFLYLSRFLVFLPVFLLGTMVSRDKLEDHLKKHSLVLVTAAVFILLLWAYLCLGYREQFYIFRHLFTGCNPFSDKVVAYGPLARLFCYTVTLLTGASVLILTPWKRIPWFTLMGTRTLNVYFWHQIFVFHLFKWCHLADLFHKGIFGKAAYFLVAVLMSIVLSSVKCFDYPMKIIKEKCFHPQKDGNES